MSYIIQLPDGTYIESNKQTGPTVAPESQCGQALQAAEEQQLQPSGDNE